MLCECEGEPGDFQRTTQRKARKSYCCDECRGVIAAGDVYEITSGKWDGYLLTYRMCYRCIDLRNWMTANVPCFCFCFSRLHQNCIDTAYAAAKEAPEEASHLPDELRLRLIRTFSYANPATNPQWGFPNA